MIIEWIVVIVTAYCPCTKCCGQWADGVTATGTPAATPGVAVDRHWIPYGSTLTVPGYGEAKADDTGGAMRTAPGEMLRIDVRFQNHHDAIRWGRRKIKIKIERPKG